MKNSNAIYERTAGMPYNKHAKEVDPADYEFVETWHSFSHARKHGLVAIILEKPEEIDKE